MAAPAVLQAVFAALVAAQCAHAIVEQVHITFGANMTEYVVQFVTMGDQVKSSTVQYGLFGAELDSKATAVPYVFVDTNCTSVRRTIHAVVLPGLLAGTRYSYRASDDSGVTWSDVFNFTTIDDNAESVTFSIFGDLATSSNVTCVPRLLEATQKGIHSFIVHVGDMAYNLNDECGAVGDAFMRDMEPVAASTPYVFGVGNHETDIHYTYQNYLNRYSGQRFMAEASGSPSIRYFSWNTQLVHFLYVDTDAWVYPEVFPLIEPQREWLRRDLERVNRTRTPWIVALGHRAMYCTKTTDGECNWQRESVRRGLLDGGGVEEYLALHGVDLYVAGHTHHTEVTYPVVRGQLWGRNYTNPRATVHVQSGIAGVDGYDPFDVPAEPWDMYRDTDYNPAYGQIVVYNRTHLKFTQYKAVDNSVLVEFVLEQTEHAGPW